MHKKHMFLRVFQKIALFICVFCVFFISPVFATLPAGYTELEYIESTGTQWIDTGVSGLNVGGWQLYVKWLVNKTGQSNYAYVIGAYQAETSNAYRIILKQTNIDSYYVSGNSKAGGGSVVVAAAPNVVHTGIIKNGSVEVDGRNYTTSTKGTDIPGDMHITLFSSKGSLTIKGRIYESWAKKDNVLRYNMIPAKRNSDGEIGMYDTVSETFFENAGTGSFIAGPIAHCKTFGTDGVACTACESGYKLDSNGGCVGVIEIATTKMVDDEFAAAEANLAATVQTIEDVVSRTITQTGQIQILQDTKQTRPDESCPANMKCLLVQDEDGTPHWYPIIEP